MQLLVSVRDGREAATALAGGAEMIDAKEPSRGPLGRVGAEEFGAYLFVRRPKDERPTLVITYKDGTECRSRASHRKACP